MVYKAQINAERAMLNDPESELNATPSATGLCDAFYFNDEGSRANNNKAGASVYKLLAREGRNILPRCERLRVRSKGLS
jgi:hypothetical protein